ncbi:hypothetical protein BHMPCIPO_00268 [Ensifer sesbaniae]|nr:hypothetical protein [Ensifer sesbaniae]
MQNGEGAPSERPFCFAKQFQETCDFRPERVTCKHQIVPSAAFPASHPRIARLRVRPQ